MCRCLVTSLTLPFVASFVNSAKRAPLLHPRSDGLVLGAPINATVEAALASLVGRALMVAEVVDLTALGRKTLRVGTVENCQELNECYCF